uniref:Ig-like domain-containing protein n=1 Tax=Cyprinodon variegatus TaxID=28743 RepID=A0A3Q2DV45_CYPVA
DIQSSCFLTACKLICYAENFIITTVEVGENVTLSCKRDASEKIGFLYWIKLVPGNMPEILGKTFTFNNNLLDTNARIATKQDHGRFVLHIGQTKLNDSAFYFCLKSTQRHFFFLSGTFLRIKGPQSDYFTVIQDSLSGTVHEGDSVNLQCSFFSQKKTCPEENRMFWLRFSSAETRPSLIYAQKEFEGKCEHNPDTQSGQSCFFSFVKENISFLDTGTYYCAVAACGRVVFGNGTKLEFEGDLITFLNTKNSLLLLCCVTLALMVIVTALLCSIRIKCFKFCKGKSTNSLILCFIIYSTAVFTQRKANRAGRIQARRKEDTIYSDVRAFDKD